MRAARSLVCGALHLGALALALERGLRERLPHLGLGRVMLLLDLLAQDVSLAACLRKARLDLELLLLL